MTDKRFLLMGLNEDGDFCHTYMKREPRGLYATKEEAQRATKNFDDEEYEIWEYKEDGTFEYTIII